MNRVEWMKGSVTYGLGADLSLPQCLSVTTGIWTLTHKSYLRAEISGSIVWYDALAPRPEVLLSWNFVCACAVLLELKFIPHSWEKVSNRVNLRAGTVSYHLLVRIKFYVTSWEYATFDTSKFCSAAKPRGNKQGKWIKMFIKNWIIEQCNSRLFIGLAIMV